MKLWIKRYLILIICYALAFFPTLAILTQSNVLDNSTSRIIFGCIAGGLFVIFIGVMSFLMFKGKSKLSKSEKEKK